MSAHSRSVCSRALASAAVGRRVDTPCRWRLAWLGLRPTWRWCDDPYRGLSSDFHLGAMVSALPGVRAAGRVLSEQAVVAAKVQIKCATVRRFDVGACNEHISPFNYIYYLLIILSTFTGTKYTVYTDFSVAARTFPRHCNGVKCVGICVPCS